MKVLNYVYSSGWLLKAVMIILITKKQSESSSRSPGEEHRDASHVVFTLLPTALQPTLVLLVSNPLWYYNVVSNPLSHKSKTLLTLV